jgi:hypothetical protein
MYWFPDDNEDVHLYTCYGNEIIYVYPGISCEVLSIALVKDKSDVCLNSYRPKYFTTILCMLNSKDWTCSKVIISPHRPTA